MDGADNGECRQLLGDELLLLSSMYGPDELRVLNAAGDRAQNSDTQIIICFKVETISLELVVQYCSLYPLYAKPTVLVRSNDLDAQSLNKELRLFIERSATGEPLTCSIFRWIQDNCVRFSVQNDGRNSAKAESRPQVYERLWIYSHHLYSAVKRRNIGSEAKCLNLNGFFISGKPGIIVIEGTHDSCQKFWESVMSYGWQKILLRHREQFSAESFLKMTGFKEVRFPSSDGRTVEYSELKKFLSELGLEYGFNILLNL